MNRVNQQGTPSEAEIAWLAGIIEGEGTVALSAYRRSEKEKPKVGVVIILYNTDAGIIKKAKEVVDRLMLSCHLRERSQKPLARANGEGYGGQDPMFVLKVSKLDSAYLLAKLIRPWCFGQKAARLDLIIEYLSQRLSKIEANGGNFRNVPIDHDDVKIVADFYNQFVKRNKSNRALVAGLLNEYEHST
ncbi:MAG: hypothetical protein OES84_00105 [Kiritimatiellaceae bacterium]|nr:hypothetical protein [Kiritimatiellaceae bacterium]